MLLQILVWSAVVYFALLIVAGVIDELAARDDQPRIYQPARATPPPLPAAPAWHVPDWQHVPVPGPAGPGRHRRELSS